MLLVFAGQGNLRSAVTDRRYKFQGRIALGRSSADYVFAMKQLERMSRELVAPFIDDFDVLVTPTMAITPPPAGAMLEAAHANPEAPAEMVIATVAFCAFANVTGLPGISLPVYWTDAGVPVGAQIVGGPWQEATLLRLGGAVEQALPWADREPGLARA